MTTDVINTIVALDERNVNQCGQQSVILLPSFLAMAILKNWFEPVLNYFMEHWMNVFTEGGSQEDCPS
jgi:hypothetical protein